MPALIRQRLRPAHGAQQLGELYPTPHDHTRWRDHHVRVDVTIAMARGVTDVSTVADLSCGNATIARALVSDPILGDMAPGYELHGPLESTISDIEPVDLYVCCETLEHLDDPDSALALIRPKARTLVLSTPVDAWDEPNVEHYWAWSREGVEEMLVAAGWRVEVYTSLDMRIGPWSPYCFGIWVCS